MPSDHRPATAPGRGSDDDLDIRIDTEEGGRSVACASVAGQDSSRLAQPAQSQAPFQSQAQLQQQAHLQDSPSAPPLHAHDPILDHSGLTSSPSPSRVPESVPSDARGSSGGGETSGPGHHPQSETRIDVPTSSSWVDVRPTLGAEGEGVGKPDDGGGTHGVDLSDRAASTVPRSSPPHTPRSSSIPTTTVITIEKPDPAPPTYTPATEPPPPPPPTYYPPAPRTPCIRIATCLCFPFYAVAYLLPLGLWTALRVLVRTLWDAVRAVGTALVWTASGVWTWVLAPLGAALGWFIRTCIVAPLRALGRAVGTYVLHPLHTAVVAVLRGVGWAVGRICAGVAAVGGVVGRCVGAVGGWVWTTVLAPLGHLLALLARGIHTAVLRPVWGAVTRVAGWMFAAVAAVGEGCWYVARTLGGVIAWGAVRVWRGVCVVARGVHAYVLTPVYRVVAAVAAGVWWVVTAVAGGCGWVVRTIGRAAARVGSAVWAGVRVVGRGVRDGLVVPVLAGLRAIGTGVHRYVLAPVWGGVAAVGRVVAEMGRAVVRGVEEVVVRPVAGVVKAVGEEIRGIFRSVAEVWK
ncbi:uncharacterized protein EV422DRAFT_601537 [Fimicolochytrium jonesii]|uniref:uncharacterized protein n=1 Tax=Fimicolochytrium jonesii TaxID=1396493 RepID=UPI0022FE8AAC|nr:uncharacterized protein EV422DRAFT_601537 [Fimicolochytrium jonesii]KAI8818746.1 hypothetical protein EV422DRAFT_601537 [Fimicolochytrium jonesii]